MKFEEREVWEGAGRLGNILTGGQLISFKATLPVTGDDPVSRGRSYRRDVDRARHGHRYAEYPGRKESETSINFDLGDLGLVSCLILEEFIL